jgi:hypothetical protein
MRRLRLVRPCPDVPPELRAAVEGTGSGHCDRCGEDVVDLVGPSGPAIVERRGGRLCGRVAVAAAFVVAATSGCSNVDVSAGPTAPAAATAPPPGVDAGTLPSEPIYYGFVEDEPVAAPPTVAPGREKPR